MAEIKVEPKRGGLGWLWAIILLAVIGAAAWYFLASSQTVPATTSPTDSVRTSMRDAATAGFAWMEAGKGESSDG